MESVSSGFGHHIVGDIWHQLVSVIHPVDPQGGLPSHTLGTSEGLAVFGGVGDTHVEYYISRTRDIDARAVVPRTVPKF